MRQINEVVRPPSKQLREDSAHPELAVELAALLAIESALTESRCVILRSREVGLVHVHVPHLLANNLAGVLAVAGEIQWIGLRNSDCGIRSPSCSCTAAGAVNTEIWLHTPKDISSLAGLLNLVVVLCDHPHREEAQGIRESERSLFHIGVHRVVAQSGA